MISCYLSASISFSYIALLLDVVNFMFYLFCVEEFTNVLEVEFQVELIFSEMNGKRTLQQLDIVIHFFNIWRNQPRFSA